VLLGLSWECQSVVWQQPSPELFGVTPLLLVLALAAAHAVEISSGSFVKFVDVGNQASLAAGLFRHRYHSQDLSRYAIPVEVLCGFFFIVIALALPCPGQELGRALKRWPNRSAGLHLKHLRQHRWNCAVCGVFLLPDSGVLVVLIRSSRARLTSTSCHRESLSPDVWLGWGS